MSAVEVVILAAGMGTRLGRPFPKPLTPLTTGETILGRQIASLRQGLGDDLRILTIVGFKLDLVIEATPDVAFAYNERFDSTNTSKSLLKGLDLTGDSGVLWLNGDVVFDHSAVAILAAELRKQRSFVCVDTSVAGAEEVKYTLGPDGYVQQLSKTVEQPVGEALGINFISGADKPVFMQRLRECADQDYFEQGLEWAIERDGLLVKALDISAFGCVEVDFEEDLTRANEFLSTSSRE